jgi:hypothetical protein
MNDEPDLNAPDVTDLFDRAAPQPASSHRDSVFDLVLAEAATGAVPDTSTGPTTVTAPAGVVVPLRPRRRWQPALAAAAVVAVVGAGALVANRRHTNIVVGPESSSTTPLATSTSVVSIIPSPSVAPITVDAVAMAKSTPIEVVTFGPIEVGDFEYGMERTPDGEFYVAGFNGPDPTAFHLDTFRDGKATRYELPASFLTKLPNGSPKYRGWTLGPLRVLYGYQYDATGSAVNVVAVPTEVKRVSQVVAKEAVPAGATCGRAPDGIRCGPKLIRSWVTPEGTTLGKSFEGDWNEFEKAHRFSVGVAAPLDAATDAGVAVALPSGRVVTFTNLRTFFGSALPGGVTTQVGTFASGECAFANVTFEGSGTTFVSCVRADGTVQSTSYRAETGSLPGGPVGLLTDGAYYTVRQTDTGSVLVKFPFG